MRRLHGALLLAVFFTLALTPAAFAQNRVDTTGRNPGTLAPLSGRAAADTLSLKDTAVSAADTSARARLEQRLGIRISPEALTSPVKATAVDSAVFDVAHNNFYLYGDAKMKYEDVELGAGRVQYNQITGIITASPVVDSLTDTTAAAYLLAGEREIFLRFPSV